MPESKQCPECEHYVPENTTSCPWPGCEHCFEDEWPDHLDDVEDGVGCVEAWEESFAHRGGESNG